MKKIVCILLTMTLFASCLYDAMYFLTDKDLEWMAPYKQGDTVLFQSSGGIDTMIVESKTLHNDHWPFVQNEGTDMYLGNASIKYGIQHDGELLKGDIVIIKKEEDCLYLGIHFGNRHYKCENEKELHFDSFTFEGIKYMDLIKVENSNSVLYDNYYLNTVYFIWSKSKGLLQYKYLNGEVYTFYKKLPYKKKGWFQWHVSEQNIPKDVRHVSNDDLKDILKSNPHCKILMVMLAEKQAISSTLKLK